MKKLTGLVILIVALVLASFYAMGYLTEKRVKQGLEAVNQTNSVSANIVDYKRGWFSSKAVFNWHFQIPEHTIQVNNQQQTIPAEDYELQTPVTIYHGPVIFSDRGIKFGLGFAHSLIQLPEKFVTKFNEFFSEKSTKPNLDLSFFINYFGKITINTSIPAFKLFAKSGNAEFDWSGMLSSTSLSTHMDRIDGSVVIDGIHFVNDQIDTTTSAITSEFDLHKIDLGLFLGDASVSFPSLVIHKNGKKMFELNQFDARSSSDVEQGLFSSQFKSSLEKVSAEDKSYGPGSLQVSIKNLDAATLAKLNQKLNELQQKSELERQAGLLTMLPELPKLFGKGAEFEVAEMSIVLPQGTIDGHLLITLPKGDVINPFELLKKIQGKGKLRMPKVVVEQLLTESIKQRLMAPPQSNANQQQPATTDNQLQSQSVNDELSTQIAANSSDIGQQAASLAAKQLTVLVQSGVLIEQGSDCVIEANLSQGQLTVNGKPFRPEMIKF